MRGSHGLSARRARRTKSKMPEGQKAGPKCCQLKVRAQRAPRLLVTQYLSYLSHILCHICHTVSVVFATQSLLYFSDNLCHICHTVLSYLLHRVAISGSCRGLSRSSVLLVQGRHCWYDCASRPQIYLQRILQKYIWTTYIIFIKCCLSFVLGYCFIAKDIVGMIVSHNLKPIWDCCKNTSVFVPLMSYLSRAAFHSGTAPIVQAYIFSTAPQCSSCQLLQAYMYV